MKEPTTRVSRWRRAIVTAIYTASFMLVFAPAAFAQSPWERAALNLQNTFTGPLSRSLALVAIVLCGFAFMFGEQGAKQKVAGVVFGGGLALFATQFMLWLF